MAHFFIYDILLSFFLLFSFPLIWKRIKNEKNFYGDWRERFGIYKKDLLINLKKRKNIWIHTVSIGEFLSVLPLINELKRENSIVVSFTTKTGRKVAEEKIKDIYKVYFPFDISFIVKKAIKTLNPKLIIIAETEIWPNLIINSYRKKIPLIIVNARLSDKAYKNYKRLRFITKRILPMISYIIAKSEREKEKILFLGGRKENIIVAGSIKFDMAYWISKEINQQIVKKNYGIKEDKKVIVFGSIHPDEEDGIVEVISEIDKRFKNVIFVIVPRYLDRTNIYKKLDIIGINYVKKSEFEKEKKDFKVIVVDTYGELNNFYSICDFAFVGGSLNGYGGQNPIEPASFGKCVICGKDMFLLKEEWEIIKKYNGGIEVKDFKELYKKIVFLLKNPTIVKELGQNSYKAVIENKGANEKTFKIIKSYLS
ncbi:MAG: 3-deoxy-D-manno-octulosonic acid transferase [Candidatus Omnitrophica bacterium]|nr:3-deoxy-D-manno-octulosonic acid transferase [Candidatus Omnitrophota bacterium]